MEELLFGLRILADLALSAVLGFCIGLERKLRYKEAGIRTHTIEGFLYCLILEKEKSHRYQLEIFSTGKKKLLQKDLGISISLKYIAALRLCLIMASNFTT